MKLNNKKLPTEFGIQILRDCATEYCGDRKSRVLNLLASRSGILRLFPMSSYSLPLSSEYFEVRSVKGGVYNEHVWGDAIRHSLSAAGFDRNPSLLCSPRALCEGNLGDVVAQYAGFSMFLLFRREYDLCVIEADENGFCMISKNLFHLLSFDKSLWDSSLRKRQG